MADRDLQKARGRGSLIRGGRRLFPVSLYATLLAALCCIAAPTVPRRVQGWLQAVLCLPLHAWSKVAASSEVQAASAEDSADAQAELWAANLRRRVERAAVGRTAGLIPSGLEPVVCRVVDRGEIGPAGLPTVLWLDARALDLADCESFVTFGDGLLGFLDGSSMPPDGEDAAPYPDLARVVLLHGEVPGRGPRRVPAFVETDEGVLRFVLGPAGRIDRWPLRCGLLEDPYEASRLQRSGQEVRTTAIGEDPLGALPAGLRVGRLQVWGYPGLGRGAPVGLFVEPHFDPRAISAVVVWRRGPASGVPGETTGVRRRRHRVERLMVPAPPPTLERWVLTADSRTVLPVGGALVRGAALFGVIEHGGPGFGLASPLGRARRQWSLVLLPDAASADPVFLVARGGYRAPDRARFTLEKPGPLPAGWLFSGANGAHCPDGLLIGRSEAVGVGGEELIVAPLPLATMAGGGSGWSVCRTEGAP